VERWNAACDGYGHARVAAVAFLMLGAAVAGAGAVVGYSEGLREARQVCEKIDYLAQRGVELRQSTQETMPSRYGLDGPRQRGTD